MKNRYGLKTYSRRSLITTWLLISILPLSLVAADDTSLNPTDNFYAWANKEWLEKTEIPADKPRVDNFTALENTTALELRDLILELKTALVRSAEQEKIVRLYDSFVNTAERNKKGITPISEDLARIDKITTHRDVAKMFAYFNTVGIDSPILIEPGSDFKNSSHTIAQISQSGLGIARDYYLEGDTHSLNEQKLYREYISKLYTLASIPDGDAGARRAFDLERFLARIQWSKVANRDMHKIYNPTTLGAFLKGSVEFHGAEILKGMGVPDTTEVNLTQPSYLTQFGVLYRSTPIASWKDYLRARLLTTYANLLTTDFRSAQLQYQKDLGLVQEEEPLWKLGVEFVASTTDMLLGRAYVERYFDSKTKGAVTELVLSIQNTYRTSIEQATWMSKETRAKALEKLNSMQFKIGYPDRWRDYSALELSSIDLTENFRRAMLYTHKYQMAKIGRAVDRNDWDSSPHEVNAFYDPTRNEFVLLAAILRAPFYSVNGDAAMNYGGLGFIIGHEIGHGFDDQGCQFDKDGNMVNWWTEKDTNAYTVKKHRLISQANAYEVLPGVFLNGAQEVGEIMGDLSGAQIALQAYRKTPGASDTAFFNQIAQTWRSIWRDEFLKAVIKGDPHPPSEFRANGIVKQFEEFHKIYGTKPGDRMYLAPEERVLMW